MGKWICRNHGENCQSYLRSIIDEFNREGYTPDTLPEVKKKWANYLIYVPDGYDYVFVYDKKRDMMSIKLVKKVKSINKTVGNKLVKRAKPK